MTRGLMRSVIAGAIALVLAVAMAGGSLPLLTGTANAAPPQDGVYQINRPIFSDSTWTLTLSTVTVVNNTLGVAVVYQNNSPSDQGLYCPDAKASLLVNGQTVTELSSYCAQNIGRTWTVPSKGTFASWAAFPTLPDQLTAFTLNNWFGWGSVPDIQLVPFYCLGGSSCNGIPVNVQPPASFPYPPEWLTNGDGFTCTVFVAKVAVLAAAVLDPALVVPAAEIEALLSQVDDVTSGASNYEIFFNTLQERPYWAAVLKAVALWGANQVYDPIRACMMTSGEAGAAVGQWLRSVIITRQA